MLTSLDIILVNRNSGGELLACLTSIAHADKTAFRLRRVSVVDDASTDGSATNCRELSLPLEIIRNLEHTGYGASCNRGAEKSSADYILFLNTDCVVFSDSLDQPILYMESPEQAGTGIVGIHLLDAGGATSRSCARFPTFGRMLSTSLGLDRIFPSLFPGHQMKQWDHLETREVDQVIGAFMLVRRSLFERLGGYDERFFVYMEDLDLSLRMSRLGYRSMYLASAKARHKGGQTARRVQAESLFFVLRSRIQYAFKHFGALRGSVVAACALGMEPLSRLVLAARRRSGADFRALTEAYVRLWGELLSGRLGGTLQRESRRKLSRRSIPLREPNSCAGAENGGLMRAAAEANFHSDGGKG